MCHAMVDIIPIEPAELPGWEPAWRDLERRAPQGAPFLCFDWLEAWTRVYEPARLAAVRVGGDRAPVALGLLELGAGGRWRFAGRPIGAERGLLCAPEERTAAWSALAAWLGAHARRWATLDVECMPADQAGALPGARREAVEVPVLALPASFEDYLAGRTAKTRARFRRILRRVAREGATLRPVAEDEVGGALADFLALHTRRAASKGERHPAVDERLAHVLVELRDAPSARLKLFELVLEGRRLGVTVRIDRPGGSWFYNAGFDPGAAAMAPGIALELTSIRDAIERGGRRLDLGPGAYPYKLELGGVVETRCDVRAASPSARGWMLHTGEGALLEARKRLHIRKLAQRALARLERS